MAALFHYKHVKGMLKSSISFIILFLLFLICISCNSGIFCEESLDIDISKYRSVKDILKEYSNVTYGMNISGENLVSVNANAGSSHCFNLAFSVPPIINERPSSWINPVLDRYTIIYIVDNVYMYEDNKVFNADSIDRVGVPDKIKVDTLCLYVQKYDEKAEKYTKFIKKVLQERGKAIDRLTFVFVMPDTASRPPTPPLLVPSVP